MSSAVMATVLSTPWVQHGSVRPCGCLPGMRIAALRASPQCFSAPVLPGRKAQPSCTARAPWQRSGRPCLVPLRADPEPEKREVVYNTEFGYSRKDIFLIGGGLIALGYAMYYGLQAMGMEAGYAGNWVQLIIFLGICVGWVSTYIYRVATKQMTYVKQLEQYEEAVMKKRLEELTDAEMSKILAEVDEDKQKRGPRASTDTKTPTSQ